jgi:hypothetical protein
MKLKNRSILEIATLCLLLPVCLLAPLTVGCGNIMYFIWPFDRTVTVPAEFDGLEDHTVAIVVFAQETTLFEHPRVPLHLSTIASAMLRKEIESVTTVDPMKVTAYQSKNINWAEMDRTALGKALKADFVLFVSLVEFSTVEEGYVDLLRGHINGEAKLFDCSKPEIDSLVWTCPNIRLEFPKTPTVRNARNEEAIRMTILKMFSDKLTKKFYSHEVNREDL